MQHLDTCLNLLPPPNTKKLVWLFSSFDKLVSTSQKTELSTVHENKFTAYKVHKKHEEDKVFTGENFFSLLTYEKSQVEIYFGVLNILQWKKEEN